MSKMLSSLAKKLGLTSSPTVTELTEALAESVDSINKADLSDEERREALKKTLAEYEVGVLEAPKGEEESQGDKDMIPEEVTKQAEALQKRLDDSEKVAKAQAETIEKLLAKDAARERLTKAQTLVGKAPVSAEDVSTLLEQLDEKGEAVLKALLTKTSELAKESHMFEELGVRGEEEMAAEQEIEKKAEVIRKANPKLTEAQAYTQALSENPELYDATINQGQGD